MLYCEIHLDGQSLQKFRMTRQQPIDIQVRKDVPDQTVTIWRSGT